MFYLIMLSFAKLIYEHWQQLDEMYEPHNRELKYSEKNMSQPLHPLQVPHGMAWDHTRASTVRGW